MDRDLSKYPAKGDAVEKRIRSAFLTLRRSKSERERRLARKILRNSPDRTMAIRSEIFLDRFYSMLHSATTEMLYPGDKRLKIDDIAYFIVREMLWRLADETGVEAAQTTAEEALEVVEDTFGRGEASQAYLSSPDFQ